MKNKTNCYKTFNFIITFFYLLINSRFYEILKEIQFYVMCTIISNNTIKYTYLIPIFLIYFFSNIKISTEVSVTVEFNIQVFNNYKSM